MLEDQQGRILRLIEKPRRALNECQGTGNILFHNRILEYLQRTPINQGRNERELPDLIQCAIDEGHIVRSFTIGGRYININTPEHLAEAEREFGSVFAVVGSARVKRTPEPELMADEAQADAYAAADLSELQQAMVNYFQSRCGTLAEGGRLLDLGCGSGDMTIRFARAHASITALGVDGSAPLLRHAEDRRARQRFDRSRATRTALHS